VAVHDLSYAPWTGTATSRRASIRALIGMELLRPFRSMWVRLVVIGAYMITGGWMFLLFFAASQQELPAMLGGNLIYRDGFLNLFLFSMILLGLSATVGCPIIARDLRHNALVLYFSRSITRGDYLLGKFAALLLFLLFATLGPGLLLWASQAGLGAERLTLGQRFADLGSLILHSLALTLPLAAVTLGFSTASKRGYVAALFWASLYFGGEAASAVLGGLLRTSWPKLLSWRMLTTHLGDLCWRGTPPRARILDCGWEPPAAILAALSVLALALAWRRLRSVEAGE
jgi:ABC-type transport system involved in multi-copper enzyme maturation permease subunit